MSRPRAYTDETKNIMLRFYEAVDALIEQKKIRGKQTYCTLAGIDKRSFYAQKEDMDRGWFQVSWMLPLITDFKVSADWLLTGKGKMLKE